MIPGASVGQCADDIKAALVNMAGGADTAMRAQRVDTRVRKIRVHQSLVGGVPVTTGNLELWCASHNWRQKSTKPTNPGPAQSAMVGSTPLGPLSDIQLGYMRGLSVPHGYNSYSGNSGRLDTTSFCAGKFGDGGGCAANAAVDFLSVSRLCA